MNKSPLLPADCENAAADRLAAEKSQRMAIAADNPAADAKSSVAYMSWRDSSIPPQLYQNAIQNARFILDRKFELGVEELGVEEWRSWEW